MSDLDLAKSFMSNFTGANIFVAMKDDNSRAPIHYHKTLEQCIDVLDRQNDRDMGIFFTVNELDRSLDPERQRTGVMFTKGRTLFLDDDKPRQQPRVDFPLIPNLIVQTSGTAEKGYKFHYYWLIENGQEDKSEYTKVQRSLVKSFDGDDGAKDATRYLRLPGFKHRKTKDGKVNDADVVYVDNELPKYDWSELKESFGEIESATVGSKSTGNLNSNTDSKTIDEYRNAILTGTDYHHGIVSLSYQFAKEGLQARYIIEYLDNLMESVSEDLRDERWEQRKAEIERIVRGAFVKIYGQNVDLSSIAEEVKLDEEIPWPPGMLGKLADDAYSMAHYQYKEVAIVSAIGLVAGIAGRKFNVSKAGLNVYLTLLMSTGMGKDSIGKFIDGTLMQLNSEGNSSSFIGVKRFTGPKGVGLQVKDARSQVSVFTEAGMLLRSTSGDQDGLTRVLLGLYSCSGHDNWSPAEAYSSAENSTESMRAVALTIVSEATPETLLDVLRDSGALENGHLPRQSIFRLDCDKPYSNKDVQSEVSLECKARLKELIGKCSKVQSTGNADFECWKFEFDSDIAEEVQLFSDKCVDMENKYRNEDSIKSIMATRMYLKAAKYAAIASTVNHHDLVIKRQEWDWAKRMVEFEYRSIDNMFQGSGFNNVLDDLAKGLVGATIAKMLNGGYKDKKVQLTKKEIGLQTVPHYRLNQALRKSIKLKFDRFTLNPSDGLKKVLAYMVDSEYLKVIYEDQNSGNRKNLPSYKPTKLFELLMKGR